jgi:hypothetical protein
MHEAVGWQVVKLAGMDWSSQQTGRVDAESQLCVYVWVNKKVHRAVHIHCLSMSVFCVCDT